MTLISPLFLKCYLTEAISAIDSLLWLDEHYCLLSRTYWA